MKIGTDENPADIGTKSLSPATFHRHLPIVVSLKPGSSLPKMNEENLEGALEGSEAGTPMPTLAAFARMVSSWNIVGARNKRGQVK